MAAPQNAMYKRTASTDDGLGFRYETKMTALAALRLYTKTDEFFLANNFAKGDKFDDIVFTARTNNQWSTWFIQLKHKQLSTLETKKISVSVLRSKGADFLLRKYFESYKLILKKFQKGGNDVIFGKNYEGSRFVMFTNASLHPDILKRNHERVDASLLSTNISSEMNIKFDVNKDQDILLGMLGDSQLNDFIDKLYFCTGQANEGDIDLLVQNEISKISKDLSVVEVKYVTHQLYDYVYSWLKTGEYLTKEHVKAVLSRTSMETQYGKKNETTLQFNSSFLKFVSDSFGDEKLIYLVSKADSCVMCLALLKEMKLQESPNMQLPLMQLEKKEAKEHLLSDWSKPNVKKTLVVDCEGDILGINLEEIAKFIKQLCAVNRENRVILLATQRNSTVLDLSGLLQLRSRKFNCSLKDLTEGSKKMLIEREVLFQGYKTLLASLMPNTKVMQDVFDMTSMTQLLQGRLVSVGIRPVEHIPYYVTRVLTRQSAISSDIFTDPHVKACFALSGISLEQAITSFPFASNIASSLNLADTKTPIKEKVIVLEGDPESEFKALSKYVHLPFHWFEKSKRGAKKWIWKKSTRNIQDVSAHVENHRDFVATDNIMVIKDKVVVITAEPGMGKSTLLDHLAAETKRLCPDIWVISVVLNDFTELLDSPDFVKNAAISTKNLIAAAAGVDKETSKFDARLFNQCYDVTGKMIVLLDGFDEITPYFTTQGLALLNTLQNSPVARVWVTARPVLRELLEKATCTLSYTIKPFETKDQRNFLNKFWKHQLPSIKEEQLNEFIGKILGLVEASFDEKLHEFTGIPLQTRMLAEVFHADIRSYHESGELLLKERINGVQLFEDFVTIKRGIQMEKAKVTVSNASARWEQKRLNEAREKDLMRLALLTLLPRNVCSELNPPITEHVVRELKQLVTDGNEKSGIVLSFKGDCPTFIHRTFAEYFVALFFTKGFESNKKFLSSGAFFEGTFEFVRYFFDRILAVGNELHEAILDHVPDGILKALAAGSQIDSLDAGGRTALHVAAALPDSEAIITALLVAGAPVDIKDKVLDWTPMQYAVKVGAVSNIAPLLERSQEVLEKGTVPITWETLRHAVRGDYLALLLHLLENGIYAVESLDELSPQKWIDETVNEGYSLLHLAAACNAAKILQYLLRKDTRDSKRRFIECKTPEGLTPLLIAGSKGCCEAVTHLVGAGADSLATSPEGKNLVQFAVEVQDLGILHIAVKDALARQAPAESFLTMAVTTLIGDKTEWGSSALQLLFSLYPKLGDLKTTKGMPILAMAAIKGNELAVRRLCELDADINVMTAHGTPLHLAVTGGHVDVVRELLACPRKQIDALDADGCTPLYKAAARGDANIFQMLIDAGANTHCKAADGSDLTHALAASCDEAIFFYLLESGFSFDKENGQGQSGLSLLQAAGATSLVQVLVPPPPEPVPEVTEPAAVQVPKKKKKKQKDPINVQPQNDAQNVAPKQKNPPMKKKPSPVNQGPKKPYDTGAFLEILKDLAQKNVVEGVDITDQLKAFIDMTISSVKTQGGPSNEQQKKKTRKKSSSNKANVGGGSVQAEQLTPKLVIPAGGGKGNHGYQPGQPKPKLVTPTAGEKGNPPVSVTQPNIKKIGPQPQKKQGQKQNSAPPAPTQPHEKVNSTPPLMELPVGSHNQKQKKNSNAGKVPNPDGAAVQSKQAKQGTPPPELNPNSNPQKAKKQKAVIKEASG